MTKKHSDALNNLVQESLQLLPKYEIVSKHLLSRTLGISLGKAKELFDLLLEKEILVDKRKGANGVIVATVNGK